MLKRKFFIAIIVIFALAFNQNLLFAKDTGKPTTSPSPNTNSNSNSNSNSNKSNSSQSQSSTGSKPSSPATSSNSEKTQGGPANSSSPSGNSASTKNSGNSSNTSTSAVSTAPTAKKSSNVKLNPSRSANGSANSKADKARIATTTVSSDCTPGKDGKAPTGNAACSDFIVVFQPGLARINSNKLVKDSGAQVLRTFSSIFNGALVNGPLAKMQALANNPNVLVVEDDLQVTTTAIQSPSPWGLDRTDQRNLPLTNSFDDTDL